MIAGTPQSYSYTERFRAVASLSRHLQDYKASVPRVVRHDDHQALLSLVESFSHTSNFMSRFSDARDIILRRTAEKRNDPDSLLQSMLYWNDLPVRKRRISCTLFAESLYRVYGDVMPYPRVCSFEAALKREGPYYYRDIVTEEAKYSIADAHRHQKPDAALVYKIDVNIHPESTFEDPYKTMAAIYRESILLLGKELSEPDTFRMIAFPEILREDRDLLRSARGNDAILPRSFSEAFAKQFFIRFAKDESSRLEEDLRSVAITWRRQILHPRDNPTLLRRAYEFITG